MVVYLARDILPFVMYCINGKPRSSLIIESTDSMIISLSYNEFSYHKRMLNYPVLLIISRYLHLGVK